jgi:hypothetical protein
MPYKGRRKDGPGSAGGKAVVAKYGRAHMRALGRLGAQALLDRHGCEHMAEIGRAGYYKVMRRYGVEPPPPPIPWNERQWLIAEARAQEPVAEQGTLFDSADTREAA